MNIAIEKKNNAYIYLMNNVGTWACSEEPYA